MARSPGQPSSIAGLVGGYRTMIRTTVKAVAVAGIAAASVGTATAQRRRHGQQRLRGRRSPPTRPPTRSSPTPRPAPPPPAPTRAAPSTTPLQPTPRRSAAPGSTRRPASCTSPPRPTPPLKRADAIGKQYAVAVKAHKVKRSAAELEADAAKIRGGKDELGQCRQRQRRRRRRRPTRSSSPSRPIARPRSRPTPRARGAKLVDASSEGARARRRLHLARSTCDWTIRAGIDHVARDDRVEHPVVLGRLHRPQLRRTRASC